MFPLTLNICCSGHSSPVAKLLILKINGTFFLTNLYFGLKSPKCVFEVSGLQLHWIMHYGLPVHHSAL